MDKMLALAAFLLSLFGCDPQRSSFVHHERNDGRDLLHARATLESGVAHFDCIASTSGVCHWRLLPARCADVSQPCPQPGQRFAVAVDQGHQVTGIARVHACVAGTAAAVDTPPAACHLLGDDDVL